MTAQVYQGDQRTQVRRKLAAPGTLAGDDEHRDPLDQSTRQVGWVAPPLAGRRQSDGALVVTGASPLDCLPTPELAASGCRAGSVFEVGDLPVPRFVRMPVTGRKTWSNLEAGRALPEGQPGAGCRWVEITVQWIRRPGRSSPGVVRPPFVRTRSRSASPCRRSRLPSRTSSAGPDSSGAMRCRRLTWPERTGPDRTGSDRIGSVRACRRCSSRSSRCPAPWAPSPRPRARREATGRATRHRTWLRSRHSTLGCRARLRPPALVPPVADPLGDPRRHPRSLPRAGMRTHLLATPVTAGPGSPYLTEEHGQGAGWLASHLRVSVTLDSGMKPSGSTSSRFSTRASGGKTGCSIRSASRSGFRRAPRAGGGSLQCP